VLSPHPRALRVAGLLAAVVAAVLSGAVGCTTVTNGDPAANSVDAPGYRTSASLSSVQSSSSSSARESERQASMTTEAVRDACETLSTTSSVAIDAVNDYVDAHNEATGQIDETLDPAVDALIESAKAVQTSLIDIVPNDMKDVFTTWIDSALTTAAAVSSNAEADEFNEAVDQLNEARSDALRLCDETY
jgi:hypothetical protein